MEEKKEIIKITGRFLSRKNTKFNSDFCINIIHVREDSLQGNELPQAVINRCKKGNGYDVTVVGYNLPTSKATYYGTWEQSKYGVQFKANTFEYVTPDTKKGLITFLSSKKFKGIGRTTATAIVDMFGMNSLDVIKNSPDKLLVIRGMSAPRIKVLCDTLRSTEFYNKLSIFLGSFGVESSKVMKIAKALGNQAVDSIKQNPYSITDIEGIGFKTADEIAKGMAQQVKTPDEVKEILGSFSRIKAATEFKVRELSNMSGDTFSEYNKMFWKLHQELNSGFDYEIVSPKDLSGALSRMFKEGIIRGYNVEGQKCVMDFESDRCEKEITQRSKQLLSIPIPKEKQEGYAKAFEKVEKGAKFPFSEDQKIAISNILKTRLAILNGGPGTGKSTCLKAITDCFRAVNGNQVAIVQVAPTGKAARRMTEATGFPSDTIHRAIGLFSSEDLRHGGVKKLPTGLIICDEVSMVDSAVMRCLLNNVDNESQIVLVGDADQLPSVGPGSVLKDMIESCKIPTYRLTENHRQASGAGVIIENARKVNEGRTDLVYSDDRFQMVTANGEKDAWDKLLKVYDTETRKWGVENVAILCPRRKDVMVSVDNINKGLQNIVNPRFDNDPFIVINGREFRVRDRVMQTKNTETASNGDVGIIRKISTATDDSGEGDTSIFIHFEDGTDVVYTPEDMKNVDLAYAMTIHKSQGSEYKCVISPFISEQKCPLFNRNILYTSITRCKEKFIVVGDNKAICDCISKQGLNRSTLLTQRLKNI